MNSDLFFSILPCECDVNSFISEPQVKEATEINLSGIEPAKNNINKDKGVEKKDVAAKAKEIKLNNQQFNNINDKEVKKSTFFTKTLELLRAAFTKTLELLRAPGTLLKESLKTPEGRQKLLVLALATAAVVASVFVTGGASAALLGVCIAGVVLASCDFTHFHLSGDKRFAGDTIGSAINYLGNKIIDLLWGHESSEQKDARRATLAKYSHGLSASIRVVFMLAQIGVSAGAMFDPTVLKLSDISKGLMLANSAAKPIAECFEALLKVFGQVAQNGPIIPAQPNGADK